MPGDCKQPSQQSTSAKITIFCDISKHHRKLFSSKVNQASSITIFARRHIYPIRPPLFPSPPFPCFAANKNPSQKSIPHPQNSQSPHPTFPSPLSVFNFQFSISTFHFPQPSVTQHQHATPSYSPLIPLLTLALSKFTRVSNNKAKITL